ncbi:MAG TPA: rod shape-determining protein MreC, partial [Dehalococcoidia bacterium]|nr:rod shape-determining protein MreC [Dehalococcoidia bacterium]
MAVSVFSIILSQQKAYDPFQTQYFRLALPLEKLVTDAANPISDFWSGASDHGDLVRENQRLHEEIERLQAEVAAREDASQRIEELQRLLEVKQGRPQDQFVLADVVAIDPSNVRQVIALNHGTSDGIQEGMVVLSQGGSLVGTVSQA